VNGLLALEDGTVFRGKGFGACRTECGEAVFNTSMTGYQEILTDPSYKAQIVTMTYPHVGNYGVNTVDVESWKPHISGFVVRELSDVASSWRSEESLGTYLHKNCIPGVEGIDTRALTKTLRINGAMKACISTEEISPDEAVQRARDWKGIVGIDYVHEVTHKEAFVWDPDDTLSSIWNVTRGPDGQIEYTQDLPHAEIPIVAIDFGIKYNILRELRRTGFRVQVVPAFTSASEILNYHPRGILLSNGPGDPSSLAYAHETVNQLLGKIPIFGICLGHQILGFALGVKTYKLPFGHRGANHPVKIIDTGQVAITSQNHGFTIDKNTINEEEVEITQINLNDNTVEGMRHKKYPAFSVQYHPEASPGPHDTSFLFNDFKNLIETA